MTKILEHLRPVPDVSKFVEGRKIWNIDINQVT